MADATAYLNAPFTQNDNLEARHTTPMGDLGALSTCESPRLLGSIKGYLNSPSIAAKGTCYQWLRMS